MTEEEVLQKAEALFLEFLKQSRIYVENKYPEEGEGGDGDPATAAEAKAVMVGILEQIKELNTHLPH